MAVPTWNESGIVVVPSEKSMLQNPEKTIETVKK